MSLAEIRECTESIYFGKKSKNIHFHATLVLYDLDIFKWKSLYILTQMTYDDPRKGI